MYKSISFWILVIFASIGALMVGTFVHEYSHYKDYSKFEKYDEEFCILNYNTSLKSSMGYYKFSYNIKDESEIYKVDKYSEIKAYTYMALIYALFAFAFNRGLFKNRNIYKVVIL